MRKNKIIITVFAILISLALSACGTPGERYESAAEKYEDADAVISHFSSTLQAVDGEFTIKTEFSGELRINRSESVEMALSGQLKTESGETVPVNAYYTGGVFYSDMAGGKYRMEMTAEEALAQIGLCGFASGLSAGDFQAVSIGENEEGDTKIEYVISPEKAVKIYGAAERMQRFALQGSAGGAVSFKETTGSVILDGSQPVSQSFSLPASIIFEDRAVAVTDSIYNEFEFFSDNIDMEFPSFSDFVKPAD